MTIRTLIEVSAEHEWDHERQLKMTLDKLGFEPKRDAQYERDRYDLFAALRERGIDPVELVQEYRSRLFDEQVAKDAA
jgi:hypothetical protein